MPIVMRLELSREVVVMSDLISRSALIESFEPDHSQDWYTPWIVDKINNAPTVEVNPVVHGEWKRVGSGSLHDTYECTNCHRLPKWDCLGDNHWRIAFTDFCPYCGANMRKNNKEG